MGGIGRIIVSFQNFHKRMNMDTWYYAKRCFLALIENLSKQIMIIPDKLYLELVNFLDNADKYGRNITTQIIDNTGDNSEKFSARTGQKLTCFTRITLCLSGQSYSAECMSVKKKRYLSSELGQASPVLLELPLSIHAPVWEY